MKNEFNYMIWPLDLITNKKYQKLTANEKILYTLLLNRKNMSRKNYKFFSDQKGIFIYYSHEQIKKHLCCSDHTVVNALNELERVGLISKVHQKNGHPLKIYVNDIWMLDKETNSFASKKSQDKLSQKPYYNSFNKEKTHTNHSPKEEKQVSFDVNMSLTPMQKNRRSFGDVKSKTKKKKTENNSQSS